MYLNNFFDNFPNFQIMKFNLSVVTLSAFHFHKLQENKCIDFGKNKKNFPYLSIFSEWAYGPVQEYRLLTSLIMKIE